MKQLLLILALIPLTVFCQNTETVKDKKVSVGLTFSPDYCYASSGKYFSELPIFGFTSGVNLAYSVHKRITLETGILLTAKGKKTTYGLSVAYWPEGVTHYTYLYQYYADRYNYHHYYVEIPLKVNFNLLTKRTKLFITAGVSPNIYVGSKSTRIREFFSEDRLERQATYYDAELIRLNLAVIAGLGFSYDLSEDLVLKIEPTYSQSLISIDTPTKLYLHSIGLDAGLYFRL